MDVAERIRSNGADLTTAERRIAEVILSAPQSVGFGTVAELARAADVGAASVVRLAAKLGFDGYTALQHAVQAELMQQLLPAAERIHSADAGSRPSHADTEAGNVHGTLDAVDETSLATLIERLTDLDRPVAMVSSDASRGIADHFVAQLHQLRPGVRLTGGGEVESLRELALLDANATIIVLDLRRYERWVLDAHRAAVERGIWTAGITDSLLSPVASAAEVAFVVTAASTGPFDSYVGALALLNLIVVESSAALRETAADRLAAIEAAWSEHGSLTTG